MIDFKNVRFTYDGQTFVLDGVNMHVEPGSFVCVLGGNGSGKSTLAKHVNVLLEPDEGEVNVLGRSTSDPEATFFIRSNAGLVFQNPDDQIVASLIENDVAFGPENLGVPADELRARVTDALAAVGLQGFEKKETNALSGGQKQRVAIAGMLAMQPKILVLDEATAMLDPRGRAGLARVCRELNEAGMTIVMITHFMEEAVHADVVFVLEQGKVAISGTPEYVLSQVERMEELSLDIPFAAHLSSDLRKAGMSVHVHVDEESLANELEALCAARGLMGPCAEKPAAAATVVEATVAAGSPALGGGSAAAVGSFRSGGEATAAGESKTDSLEAESPHFFSSASQPSAQEGAPACGVPRIEFRGVSYSYDPVAAAKAGDVVSTQADWGNAPDELWALRDVSFSLYDGEFFGIAGHTGSGKSTLVQHMNGLITPTKGAVLVDGVDIANKSAATAARASVGLVFQYPEHQLFASTVYDDVAFGPRNMGEPEDKIPSIVREALELVDMDFDAVAQASPFELSGGQQRRVAFAGVLAMHPRTLILDEPAAGLDPEGRRELLALVNRLHADLGSTIVMISHDMDSLAALCDRILVLNTGRVFALGTPAEVFGDAAAMKSIGLDVPSPQRFANALAQRGVALDQPHGALFDQKGLVAALSALWQRGA